MVNNLENDKSSKPKTIRLQIIDNLLSSGWFSHLDMCIEMDHAEGLTGVSRDPWMTDLDYYERLMDKDEQGNQRGHLDAVMRQLVDIWALVRRGVDIQGILDRGSGNNPIRDEFRQILIESKSFDPKCYDEELDEFEVTTAFRTYLRNSTQSLCVYRYRDEGYSIFKKMPGASKSDWEIYNDELRITKIQRKITPDIHYDSSEAEKYGIIPDPDVISRKVKALMIKALQDELLRDTTGAVQRRLEEIERLKKNKPAGWMNDTSETYLNAIYDGRGIIEDLDLSPIIHHFGSHLMDRKEYSQGHSFLKESLETIRETMLAGNDKAKEEYALILQNLAALHSFTGNFVLSEEESIEALGIFRELSSADDAYTYGVAILLSSLASIHVKMRKYDSVEEEYDEAARLFSRLSDQKPTEYLYMLVECITSLANYYYLVRRLDESIEAFERAMPFLDKLTEKNFDDFAPQKVNAMINYSLALQDSGAVQKAEDILHESIHLTHVLNERCPNVYNEELSTALQDLGTLFGETGEPDRAREVLLKAEGLRRELANSDPNAYNCRLATTLDSLANLDLFAGDSNEAIYKWKEALSLLEIYDDDESNNFSSAKGQYCFYIGLTFLNLGDKENALSFLSRAESLFRTVFDRNSTPQMFEDKYAMTLSYLGVLYESMEGKEDDAERMFEESLDIALWFNSCANTLDQSFLILVYCNYAPFLFNRGRYEEAKQMWEQAVTFGDAEEGPSMYSDQSQGLLDLARQNILEAEYRIEHPEDDESDEEGLSDETNTPSFSPEVAIEAVKSIAGQINALDKDNVNYREKCIGLYRDSLQYCSSIPESYFLADYLSSLCRFIFDSYIFKPIIDIAPVALGIFEKTLQENNSCMQTRLKYIELLSIYCRSLDEYNHHDELYHAIESAFDLLKPIVIDRQDDVACTYTALKGEVMLDFITNHSSEDAHSISLDVLKYYHDVSRPRKDYMCRLLTKAAIIACENEKYYEAEELLNEAEEVMKDCDLNDMNNRLCLGELYIFKGRYIHQTPLKWPDNYAAYSTERVMEAFSYAQQILEVGVVYNPAAFKCKLLELHRSRLMHLRTYMSLRSKEVLAECQQLLKLINELTDINEHVFTWRSVDAYLEIVEALQEIYFSDYYNNTITLDELEKHYQGSMSMFTHMESMLSLYKETDPSLYSDYISAIAKGKKELKKYYRAATS